MKQWYKLVSLRQLYMHLVSNTRCSPHAWLTCNIANTCQLTMCLTFHWLHNTYTRINKVQCERHIHSLWKGTHKMLHAQLGYVDYGSKGGANVNLL